MPVVVGDTINDTADWLISSPLRSIVMNPISAAILISIVILLSALWIYHVVEIPEETSLSKLTIKLALYSFITTSIVLFLHDKVMIHDLSMQSKPSSIQGILPTNTINNNDLIPVNINVDFTK